MNTKVKTEERVQRLVMVMGKGAHPRRELMAVLGLRQESRRNFYDNYMKPARIQRLIVTSNVTGIDFNSASTGNLA